MAELTERVEIRLSPEDMARLKREARRRRLSVGALVREAIRVPYAGPSEERARAAEALARIGAPIADWPEIEREVEEARAGGRPRARRGRGGQP